jgi:cytochrome c553
MRRGRIQRKAAPDSLGEHALVSRGFDARFAPCDLLKGKFGERRNTMDVRTWMSAAKKWFLPIVVALLFLPAGSAFADAEASYKAKCAGCHAPDGSGNSAAGKAMKVRDFHAPEVQKETDAEMTDIIANGKNKMPKYADKLKGDEIKDLVAYVRALGKK